MYLFRWYMHAILISYKIFSGSINFIGVKIAHSLHELFLMLDFRELTKGPLVHGWVCLLGFIK